MTVNDIFETTKRRLYGLGRGFSWQTVLKGTTQVIGGGSSKAESEQAALLFLQGHVTHMHQRGYCTSPSGKTTFAVYYAGGWCYDIVNHQGKISCSVCTGNTLQECYEAASQHAASYED